MRKKRSDHYFEMIYSCGYKFWCILSKDADWYWYFVILYTFLSPVQKLFGQLFKIKYNKS